MRHDPIPQLIDVQLLVSGLDEHTKKIVYALLDGYKECRLQRNYGRTAIESARDAVRDRLAFLCSP